MVVLPVNSQFTAPELLPLEPDVMESQLSPDVTEAVHDIVPTPVFDTPKLVVPESFETLWVEGLTESTMLPAAWVTVTSIGLPVAPVAVTRIVPVRVDVVLLAV